MITPTNLSLSKSTVTYFSKKGKRLSYKKGHLINRPEDTSQGVYYLEQGQVLVYAVRPDGSEQYVALFPEKSIFSQNGTMLGLTPTPVFFEAFTDCVVYRLSTEIFLTALAKNKQVLLAYVSQVYYNNYYLVQQVLNLGDRNIYRRMVVWLLMAATFYGIREGDQCTVRIPLTQEQIASFLCVTRECVGKAIRKIRRRKLVIFTKKRIIIPSLTALRKEIGQE